VTSLIVLSSMAQSEQNLCMVYPETVFVLIVN